MMLVTGTVLFFATFGFAAAAVNSTRNHTARFATSNVTELTVQLDVPGNITWHSDSGELVRFVITEHGETVSEVETIQITFLESENSPVLTLQVDITSTSSAASALGENGNAQSSLPTANVAVHIPRNFIFKRVELVASKGSIQVDQGLIKSAAPLHCTSGSTSEVCPMCCSGNGMCLNGVCQCSVGYRNGTSDCDTKSETTLRLFINPNDPVIMAADTPEGDELYMIGEKDSNGQPVKINRFEVKDSEGNVTYSELNENGTIASAIHSSGMRLNFIWDSNYTSVHVSLVLPNSSQPITINLDLTENITNTTFELDGEIVERRSVPDAYPQLRKQFHGTKTPLEKQSLRKHKPKGKRQTSRSAARVSVNVLSCGNPVKNAIVKAYATVEEMTTIYNGVPSSMPGLYYIIIPTKAASTIIGENKRKTCRRVQMILSKTCNFYGKVQKAVGRVISKIKRTAEKHICSILAKGLKMNPYLRFIPRRFIRRFCRMAFQAANFFCDKIVKPILKRVKPIVKPILKWVKPILKRVKPIPKRVIKKSDLICELITDSIDNAINSFRNTEVYLTPYAVFPAGHTVFAPRQRLVLPPGSSDVSTVFTIDDNSLQITSLTVFPEDPIPRKSYTVTIKYKCYTQSTHTTMSIMGTDGYTESMLCSGGPTCVLNVLGAEALVHDTITVMITDPASPQSMFRQVMITF